MPGTLVVFDRDPGICCLLSVAVETLAAIAWTTDESEALRAICQLKPDMLLLGAAMPHVEWRGLFQAARAKAGACQIIGIAAPEHLSAVRRFAEFGVDGMFWRTTEMGQILRRASATLSFTASARLPWEAHNRHVDRALTYLAVHFIGRVTLQDVARTVGVSVSHLAHVFAAAA